MNPRLAAAIGALTVIALLLAACAGFPWYAAIGLPLACAVVWNAHGKKDDRR